MISQSTGHLKNEKNPETLLAKTIQTQIMYRMRAIKTRGLYILKPLFEGQKGFFKELYF